MENQETYSNETTAAPRLALRRGNKDTRWVKVVAEEIGDDDAVLSTLKFDVEVKLTRLTDWEAEVDDVFEKFTVISGQHEILRRKIVNYRGLKLENGADAPFSPAGLQQLIDEPFISNALYNAVALAQGGKHSEGYKAGKRKI